MCGPPAALYAAVENVRKSAAFLHKRRKPLMLTSPLVLLAASVAWWIAFLVLTHRMPCTWSWKWRPCLAIAEAALGYAVPVGLLAYVRLIYHRP